MSEVIGDIAVKLSSDTLDLERGFAKSSQLMKNFAGEGDKLAGRINALGGVMASLAPVAFAREWVKAFAADEESVHKLHVALKMYGEDVRKYTPVLEEFAAQIKNTTTFTDEEARSAMALGLRMGIHAEKIEEATRAAVGLSKTLRGEVGLTGAMMMLVRGGQGHTAMLSRQGIALDETASKAQRYQQLLKIGVSNYGLAGAELDTLSGKMKQMGNEWGELKETLGKFIVEVLKLPEIFKKLTDGIRGLVEWLSKLSPFEQQTIGWVVTMTALLPPLVKLFKLLNIQAAFLAGVSFVKTFAALSGTLGAGVVSTILAISGALVAVAGALGTIAGLGIDKLFAFLSQDGKGLSDWYANLMVKPVDGKRDPLAQKRHDLLLKAQSGEMSWNDAQKQGGVAVSGDGADNPLDIQAEAKLQANIKKLMDIKNEETMALARDPMIKLGILKEQELELQDELLKFKKAELLTDEKAVEIQGQLSQKMIERKKLEEEIADRKKNQSISMEEKLLGIMVSKGTYLQKEEAMNKQIALTKKQMADEFGKAGESDKYAGLKEKLVDQQFQLADIMDKSGPEQMRYAGAVTKGSAEAYRVENANVSVQASIAKWSEKSVTILTKSQEYLQKIATALSGGSNSGDAPELGLIGGGG